MRPYNATQNQHTKTKARFRRLLYVIRPGKRVGLFWWNGKEWKSKKIDEASNKGRKQKVKDTRNRVKGAKVGK